MGERHDEREGEGPRAAAWPEPAAGEQLLWALRPGFVLEVQQSCAHLTEDVLALESPSLPPPARDGHRERALRLLHGLQGSAATLGAPALSERAQVLGARLRALSVPLSRPVADALLYELELLLRHAQDWGAGRLPGAETAGPADRAAQPVPASAAASAEPDAVSGGAALAARLGALQARLERGAEALAQASAGLSGAGLDAQVQEALHEALRALREGSAQARALAGALAPTAAGAPDGEGA